MYVKQVQTIRGATLIHSNEAVRLSGYNHTPGN